MTPPPRHRVVIVEDEDVVLKTLIRLLRRTYEVQGVSSWEEAKTLLAEEPPAAVLCDLHLQDAGPQGIVDGLSSMQVDQRTVFMSGGAMGDDDENSFDELPGPLLRKPFAPGELRALLARVIEEQ